VAGRAADSLPGGGSSIMKIARLGALCTCLFVLGSPVLADEPAGQPSWQAFLPFNGEPQAVRPTTESYYTPQDGSAALAEGPTASLAMAPKAPAAVPAPATVDEAVYPCEPNCAGREPWKLPQPCVLQRMGITTGGWLQQGITVNAANPQDRFNGPLATNDRSDEYQLNQAWLYFVRPTNTGGCGWDVGGRVDVVYGTDWRFGKSFGLEDRIDSANSFYGLILPQFYGEVAYNNLTVKMGHYATAMSYEMVPAVGNFFYSHSYAMSYGVPLLVTGVEASYKLNEHWTAIAGFNRGWMMFEDMNHDLDFLGGVKWSDCDKRTNLSFMMTSGAQDPAGLNNRFAYSLVFDTQLTERFRYAFEHNLGTELNGDPRTGDNASWYGLSQYFFYTLNQQWIAGLRLEVFRDNNGSRVAGVGNWIGSDKGWQALPGFDGDFWEISAGLNWKPRANLALRPELRYDWYEGTRNLNNPAQLPFNMGTASNQFTFAVDLIWTF
jgi:hypothetical protein